MDEQGSTSSPVTVTILSELGRGTTGIVYRARSNLRDGPVVIKLLYDSPKPAQADEEVQFEREIRALISLTQSGIVRLIASGIYRGRPYYLRDFVEGYTLTALADAKAVDLRRGSEVLSRVAGAVQFVHDNGFAHRNLSASNVLIGKRGDVVLIGFGRVDFLTGSPNLKPGEEGTPVEVDVRGLQDLLRRLAKTWNKPLPPRLERACEPGGVNTAAAFAEILSPGV